MNINKKKYQRLKPVQKVIGFVVNIHDVINFDIDLDIPNNLRKKYQNVVCNKYIYQDLGNDFLENPNFEDLNVTPKIGLSYRCRLKGIAINEDFKQFYRWKNKNQLYIEVKQLIDLVDGWVLCNLFDIDTYQRLIVDIFIVLEGHYINLANYLLLKAKNQKNPIFQPYKNKKAVLNSIP